LQCEAAAGPSDRKEAAVVSESRDALNRRDIDPRLAARQAANLRRWKTRGSFRSFSETGNTGEVLDAQRHCGRIAATRFLELRRLVTTCGWRHPSLGNAGFPKTDAALSIWTDFFQQSHDQ
jgi:hypothetical protein